MVGEGRLLVAPPIEASIIPTTTMITFSRDRMAPSQEAILQAGVIRNARRTTGGVNGSIDHLHNTSVGGQTGGRNIAHDHAISGSTQNTGSGATHSNMPPAIICNAIVVAE